MNEGQLLRRQAAANLALRQVDGTLLLAFDTLMQERHVSRAAVRLGVTQSALSGMLTRLRKLFRDELFIRNAKGMQPTPVAIELLSSVQNVLNTLRSMVIDPTDFSPEAGYTFVIGMSDYSSCVVLPPMFRTFRRNFPNITLHAETVSAQAAPTLLDEGKIDLMVGPFVAAADRFKHSHLLSDGFVAMMATSHPAAGKKLDLKLFSSLPHMLVAPDGLLNGWRGLVDESLEKRGFRRDVRLTISQFMVGFLVLQETDMIFSLPSRIAKMATRHFDFELKAPPVQSPKFSVSQIWHIRNDLLPSNVWLRSQIAAVASSL